MMTDTLKRTLRIPLLVDKALAALAEDADMEVSEFMVDRLSDYAITHGRLEPEVTDQLRKEQKIKQYARDRAKEICAYEFDSDVTLKIFQELRTIAERSMDYKIAIGGDPFSRNNHTQARINRSLGSIIKNAVKGEAATTAHGHRINATVDGEFIKSYTPLSPRPNGS